MLLPSNSIKWVVVKDPQMTLFIYLFILDIKLENFIF